MDLNYTDLAYFIVQLAAAAKYFGFSDQDSQTFSTQINSLYNTRCSPPVNGQLLSLCQDTSCPLAEPSPNCALYENLQPNGGGNTSTPSANVAASSTPTVTSTMEMYTIAGLPTISNPPQSSIPAATSSVLSKGAIVGIAIGATAIGLFLLGILIYFWRRRQGPAVPSFVGTTGYTSPSAQGPGSQADGPVSPRDHTNMRERELVVLPYTGDHMAYAPVTSPRRPSAPTSPTSPGAPRRSDTASPPGRTVPTSPRNPSSPRRFRPDGPVHEMETGDAMESADNPRFVWGRTRSPEMSARAGPVEGHMF